jgi:hypothetical protein
MPSVQTRRDQDPPLVTLTRSSSGVFSMTARLLALLVPLVVAPFASAQPVVDPSITASAQPAATDPADDHGGFPPDAVAAGPDLPGAMIYPDLPPGMVLIEGDIQVREEEHRAAYRYGPRATYGAVSYWTSQVVPFDFVTSGGGAVTGANQTRAIDAMNAIASRTGLTFRAATGSDADRIRFQNSTGNNSPVGRQGGTQTINIVSWGTQFVIIHELYHSLGFWHEQSRSDRDSFIIINTANVSTTACGGTCIHNFNINNSASAYGSYDFDSFMHYGRTAFSTNGQNTITVREPWTTQWQNAIGQLDHFSFFDEITCRGIYPRANDVWYDPLGFPNGRTIYAPLEGALRDVINQVPSGTTVFVKSPGNYHAVGSFSHPVTIRAPLGARMGD